MRIPMERRIGESIARGQTLIEAFPEYLQPFRDLHNHICMLIGESQVDSAVHTRETIPSASMEMGGA
jgi:hypothetical protein